MRLSDGTVVPSHVKVKSTPTFDAGDAYGNLHLRLGEVVEVIPPKDKRNLNGKFREYKVLVHYSENGQNTMRYYDHCVLMNPLGSLADKTHFSLRTQPRQKKGQQGKGAKVLLMCIDGEANNAVIIGGLRDSADTADNDDGTKSFYKFTFNGITAEVNDAGELTVTRSGRTDIDGKTTEPSSHTSQVKLYADGSASIQNGSNLVYLNAVSKKVEIHGEADVDVSALGGNVSVNATTGRVDVKAATVLIESSGSIGLSPAGGSSAPLVLGRTAAQPALRGGPYRAAQKVLDSQLQSTLTAAAIALGKAALSLGNGDLGAAGAALGQAAAAVAAFEGRAPEYLSSTIFSD